MKSCADYFTLFAVFKIVETSITIVLSMDDPASAFLAGASIVAALAFGEYYASETGFT